MQVTTTAKNSLYIQIKGFEDTSFARVLYWKIIGTGARPMMIPCSDKGT